MYRTRRASDMERAVRDMLKEGVPVWIPDKKIDMSVFAEYPKQREGIAVYYPIHEYGSCAEPVYVHFYRSASGMSIELATRHDYAMQEKERIGYLLRR